MKYPYGFGVKSSRLWLLVVLIIGLFSLLLSERTYSQTLTPEKLKRAKELASSKDFDKYLANGGDSLKTIEDLTRAESIGKDRFNVIPSDTAGINPVDSIKHKTNKDSISVGTNKEGLPYFGYDIFNLKPGTIQPSEIGPVPPDYQIGPGDEIIVTVWGDDEFHKSMPVGREGYILLPEAGRLLVNGLNLDALNRKITKRLSKIYSGINPLKGKPTTYVDVSLGKLRNIKIFILGEVNRPGGYIVSAISNVFNALYYAGGPTIKGTMRKVQLIRNNKKIAVIDLYDYLLAGDNAKDIRLENGDAIFVEPVGPRAKIRGEVKRPAIYELAEGETLASLIRNAGGLKSTAYLRRSQIHRVVPFDERNKYGDDWVTIDVDLEAVLKGKQEVVLNDHDDITIFSVGDELKNYVSITGDVVKKPGRYELLSGMRLSDLIRKADSLKGDVYWDYAHLIRTDENKKQRIISFNLRNAIGGIKGDDIELQPRDSIKIYSIWDFNKTYTVSISGAVQKPGDYKLYEGMGLRDLILMAGGFKSYAYRDTIEISRLQSQNNRTKTNVKKIYLPNNYLDGDDSEIVELKRFDKVFVRSLPDWKPQQLVGIQGEVKFPGDYALTGTDETILDLIHRAGGLNPDAYPKAAIFSRDENNSGRLAIDLVDVLKNPKSKYNLTLVGGDKLYIPKEPKTVKVVGEVNFPSSILYEKGKGYRYYIEQAGGYKDSAEKRKVSVVMANGKVKTPKLLSFVKPDAGSTIIVPARIEKEKGETLKDVVSIIGIVSSAATTIFLIKQTTK